MLLSRMHTVNDNETLVVQGRDNLMNLMHRPIPFNIVPDGSTVIDFNGRHIDLSWAPPRLVGAGEWTRYCNKEPEPTD